MTVNELFEIVPSYQTTFSIGLHMVGEPTTWKPIQRDNLTKFYGGWYVKEVFSDMGFHNGEETNELAIMVTTERVGN